MVSIVTLTLNPTIDVAYSLERLEHTDKLRADSQLSDPGGGGINVARVFVRLGGNARCVYLRGGATGIALDALLDLHQLVRDPIAIKGETRVGTTILERSSGEEYRVVPAGPVIGESECQACLDRLAASRCDFLVLSGSLPRGVPGNFYARAVTDARRRGVRTVLDCSGEPLKAAMAAGGIELVKPNLKEFQDLIGEKLVDPVDIGAAAQDLVRKGAARLVAVSLAERGGILASADRVVECRPPRVETLSSVGAGDSAVAAMVHGLAKGWTDENAFAFGVAAGSAALLTAGTGLARPGDVERLHGMCEVHP